MLLFRVPSSGLHNGLETLISEQATRQEIVKCHQQKVVPLIFDYFLSELPTLIALPFFALPISHRYQLTASKGLRHARSFHRKQITTSETRACYLTGLHSLQAGGNISSSGFTPEPVRPQLTSVKYRGQVLPLVDSVERDL